MSQMLQSWLHEWRLLRRAWISVAALLLLFGLSAAAVLSGLCEVQRQRETITRLALLQQDHVAAASARPVRNHAAGSAAYYSFYPTWDPPSSVSFLALGLRDTSPYVLRVRALALQAQLHEGESHNPEMALLGRLDFAFVLVYLAPLFLIALLYDLVSSERAAGRLATLTAMPAGNHRLWLRRAALRAALVVLMLSVPMCTGAWWSGTPPAVVLQVFGASLGYVLFWAALALWVAGRRWTSTTNAVVLVGCWAVLTLVLPTLANLAITRAVPAQQGTELMLAQREAVHSAWDQPRESTMQRFFQTHPQWRDTASLPPGFHWKWYYAFQQLGDESVADQVAAYRAALLDRQRWTSAAGWLLPPVAVQTALHRLAGTDLIGQLAYQDAIAAFHARLRGFYYPYLFNDTPFGAQDAAAAPRFEPDADQFAMPMSTGFGFILITLLMLRAGWLGIRQIQTHGPSGE